MPSRSGGRRVVAAGAVAAVLSGAPSTLHAVVTGADPWAATLAAGSVVLPHETRRTRLVLAAGVVHGALSLGWAVVLARVLRRPSAITGAVAGLGIAALDLGLIGRRLPSIRALPQAPQVADHVAYGVAVAMVLERWPPGRP